MRRGTPSQQVSFGGAPKFIGTTPGGLDQGNHVQKAGRLHEADMGFQKGMRGRDRFARPQVKRKDDFLMDDVEGAEDFGKRLLKMFAPTAWAYKSGSC